MWDEAQLATAAKYLNSITARDFNSRPFNGDDVSTLLNMMDAVPAKAKPAPDPGTAAELAVVKAKLAKLEAAITAAGLTIQEAE